jgi:N-acetylglucosamine kinase-like BadF-type ATPase
MPDSNSKSNHSTNTLVIGVDGGGTRTRARLADIHGKILGNGEAGTSNPTAGGFDASQAEILAAIQCAFDDAQMPRQMAAAACFGIGGVDRADQRALFNTWGEQNVAAKCSAMNDGEIVIAAGSAESWGIALIAGTGSIAWGKTRDGKIARAGGWGYLLGDEGSGYDLARRALRAAARAADGRGTAKQLLAAILAHWKLNDPYDLIAQVYRSGYKPADIAQIAPLVLRLAEQGDASALTLVDQAARALATTVGAVARSLEFKENAIPLSLTGGLLLQAESLRQRVLAELEKQIGHFAPVTLVEQPVLGAVRIAMRVAKG